MWLSDLINKLDDALKFVLPEPLVEKVVDPITDVAGAVVNGVSGDVAGAAKDSLGLAEDFAQWAGADGAARDIGRMASLAGSLLEVPLSNKFGRMAAEELAVRASCAAAGGIAGGAATGSVDGMASYAQATMSLGATSSMEDFSSWQKRVARGSGAIAGGTTGAVIGGDRGLRTGLVGGSELGGRIGSVATDESSPLAAGVIGLSARVGGLAVALEQASASAPHSRRFASFEWAAKAGASADAAIQAGVRIADGEQRITRSRDELLKRAGEGIEKAQHLPQAERERLERTVRERIQPVIRDLGSPEQVRTAAAWRAAATVAERAADVGAVVARGIQLQAEKNQDRAARQALEIPLEILSGAAEGFEKLAHDPVTADTIRGLDAAIRDQLRKAGNSALRV
jgi:hypothetical protein